LRIPAPPSFPRLTFAAPKAFPDQVKLPNVLVTITATSNADKKKTGTFKLVFDSGVRVSISPATATVATTAQQQFLAKKADAPSFSQRDYLGCDL